MVLRVSKTSVEAARKRIRKKVLPLLETIYGAANPNAPKEVDIDMDNNLLINGTPVADWREVRRFEISGTMLVLKCGEAKRVTRLVLFGVYAPGCYMPHKICGVYECEVGATKYDTVYEYNRAASERHNPAPKPILRL